MSDIGLDNGSREYEMDFYGRVLSVELGKYASFANGCAFVRYGDTTVLTTVVASRDEKELDFFPLMVDYEEKMYSVGRIPGGFVKREGKPCENAILTSRMIDRSIRPLFSSDMKCEVSVVSTVLSVDRDSSPEFCAVFGTSVALAVSDIPVSDLFATIFIGLIDNKFVVNPNLNQRQKSSLRLVVSATKTKILMMECDANEITERQFANAIEFAHKEIKKILELVVKIRGECGKQKFPVKFYDADILIYDEIKKFVYENVIEILSIDDKIVRQIQFNECFNCVCDFFREKFCHEFDISKAKRFFYKIQRDVVREGIFSGKRIDGRGLDDIRPICAETGVLKRTHGSAVFSRGSTQVLTVATLGMLSEYQAVDGLEDTERKRYMHHYNFPSFSVGETKPPHSPGRREIGHGSLVEKSLERVLPSEDEFPYTIRLVSEVLASNGSTSQASICSGTLALIDAGVPIRETVAGISVGLVSEGKKSVTFVDILGLEDFFGDMDFKIAGTKNGITAVQLDTKIRGITKKVIKESLEKAKKARNYILEEVINPIVRATACELSNYAPKIEIIEIPVSKIKEIIGFGGRIVQKIIFETNVRIDVQENGKITISSYDEQKIDRAKSMINAILSPPKVGDVFCGPVVTITDFGAFVELIPGRDGMLHISRILDQTAKKVTDVLSVGDLIKVEIVGIDSHGKVSLKWLRRK